jgi:hypothetical protein
MVTNALAAAAILVSGSALLSFQQQKTEQRIGERTTTQTAQENAGIDRGAAVGHALCMAIEGSELALCAQSSRAQRNEPNQDKSKSTEPGDVSGALQQHSRSAFQASTRLFDAVKTDENNATADNSTSASKSKACEEFYTSARNYAKALEAQSDGQSTGLDPAKTTLLNHAVKEAVGAVGLRKLIQHHNDHSSAAMALMSHADEMFKSSREALKSAGGDDISRREALRPTESTANNPQTPKRTQPDNAKTAADPDSRQNPNANSQNLIRLANEVIRAAEALENENPAQTRAPSPNR